MIVMGLVGNSGCLFFLSFFHFFIGVGKEFDYPEGWEFGPVNMSR